MPMDTTDYDRIQEIVDKAFKRLENQVSLMMPKDESLTRHMANTDRISQVEKRLADVMQNLADTMKWSMQEHEKIREASSIRIEKLESSVNTHLTNVEASIDAINKNISESRANTLRTVIGYIVSFIIGGGALGIIEYLRSFHP